MKCWKTLTAVVCLPSRGFVFDALEYLFIVGVNTPSRRFQHLTSYGEKFSS
jgi:hypothetical protein